MSRTRKQICPDCDNKVTPAVCSHHEDCIVCPVCGYCDRSEAC